MDWHKWIEFMPYLQGTTHQRRISDRKIQWNEIVKAGIIVGLVLYGDHLQLHDLSKRVGRISVRVSAVHAELDQVLIATQRRK